MGDMGTIGVGQLVDLKYAADLDQLFQYLEARRSQQRSSSSQPQVPNFCARR